MLLTGGGKEPQSPIHPSNQQREVRADQRKFVTPLQHKQTSQKQQKTRAIIDEDKKSTMWMRGCAI